jgi:large subunit ribosomal protein L15
MGKTSTRGHKGQNARKGHKGKLGFEGGQMPLIRRLPKRGFTNPTRVEYGPVNVEALEIFENGTVVTLDVLRQAGMFKSKFDGVKILGTGELTKKLTLKVSAVSATAKAKIEAAGGTVEIV